MTNRIILAALLSASATLAQAEIIAPLDNSSYWTVMGAEDQTTYKLTPGYGGQYFDAEYLLYHYDDVSHELTIALQTGFDIHGDNRIKYGNNYYWGGDLALSFDGVTLGNASTYEYAIDFGLATGTWYDRSGTTPSITAAASGAGLYAVSNWNNQVYGGHGASSPFAMQSGAQVASVSFSNDASGYFNSEGYGGNNTSYYQTMSFDLDNIAGLDLGATLQLDAHWTMSCGNDAIDGSAELAPVPEPSVLFLLGGGLLGLVGVSRVKSGRK